METSRRDDQVECFFEGRLDTICSANIAPQIDDTMLDLNKPLVFNLEQVEYISSAFLRICVKCAQATKDTGFSVTHLSPRLRKVFKMAGLGSFCRG